MYIIKTYDNLYNDYYYSEREPFTKLLYGFYTGDINDAYIFTTREGARIALKPGKKESQFQFGELSEMLKHEHAVKVKLVEVE